MKPFIESILGNKQVSLFSRLYGWFFMILSIFFFCFWGIPEFSYWILPYVSGESVRNLFDFLTGLFIGGIFPVIVTILLFRLGQGLVRGERFALQGALAIGIIAIIIEMLFFLSTSLESNKIYYLGLIIIDITIIINIPLLLIGRMHWH
ncbi:MAG: hypothetical protein ACE14V_15630 [bacterium]